MPLGSGLGSQASHTESAVWFRILRFLGGEAGPAGKKALCDPTQECPLSVPNIKRLTAASTFSQTAPNLSFPLHPSMGHYNIMLNFH